MAPRIDLSITGFDRQANAVPVPYILKPITDWFHAVSAGDATGPADDVERDLPSADCQDARLERN